MKNGIIIPGVLRNGTPTQLTSLIFCFATFVVIVPAIREAVIFKHINFKVTQPNFYDAA